MLAGDQLYVDLDPSPASLPRRRPALGSAVIEVSSALMPVPVNGIYRHQVHLRARKIQEDVRITGQLDHGDRIPRSTVDTISEGSPTDAYFAADAVVQAGFMFA
jgi:hypothetical protein